MRYSAQRDRERKILKRMDAIAKRRDAIMKRSGTYREANERRASDRLWLQQQKAWFDREMALAEEEHAWFGRELALLQREVAELPQREHAWFDRELTLLHGEMLSDEGWNG